MSEALVVADSKTVLGQPRALVVLFFAEMWERFSFYGMRGLLIFYLTQHLLFGDTAAAGIYASYGALVYLMPLIGGMIADRYLGFRKAVIFGAVLLCIGHFGMAIEGEPARMTAAGVARDPVALQTFYASLAFIIIGVGFLKPSISSIVGGLYAKDDPRRDGGFTFFYMGINLGAMLASLIVGYLGQTFGWAYGFGLAGFGMLAGLVTFVRGQHLFDAAGRPSDPVRLTEVVFAGMTRERIIYGASLIAVVVAWQLVQWHDVVGRLLLVAAAITVVGIVGFAVLRLERVERDRMLVVLFLTSVSVVFWAFFEQAGSSMNLFTERNVDKHIFGFAVRASQFQAFNPAFIILLAPVFSWLWVALARRRFEPSTPAKFGLGVVQVGLGFAALVYGAQQADSGGIVAAGWLALAYLLHTTGELCVSPVGLSMVTKLSVPRVVGLMMGVWLIERVLAVRRRLDRGRCERIGDPGRRGRRWRRFARDLRCDVPLARVGRGRRRSRRARRVAAGAPFHARIRTEVLITSRPVWVEYKTARCILWSGDRFLLVVHHSYLPYSRARWGLPGGRIEVGESAEAAARREVSEELNIELGELVDCGDYRYKGARHKVFGTRYDGVVSTFDHNEIERIGWHSLDEVAQFERDGRLHAGYEREAIDAFLPRFIV